MVMPSLPPVSLGISPSSSAMSETGLDMFGNHGGGMTGAVSFGGAQSPFTGLVRDLAIAAGVALAAKYLWRKMK